jgi:hypothetical protein
MHLCRPEAKFLVPDWGIYSTLALVCRTGPPAYVCSLAGRYDYAIVDYIPQSGTKHFASDGEIACLHCFAFASIHIRKSARGEVMYYRGRRGGPLIFLNI